MKSTYKLLGLIYDKLSEAKCKYVASSYDDTILDISAKRSIFDVDEYVRKINLSYMLSIETMEQLSLLLEKIADLDKVILVSDVKTNNRIINTFISKRTKQILGLLENKCGNVALCDATSD